MSKCVPADKPLISILMAVYEPRMDWLREQLSSLNAQTYPNLRLYIRDDCSPTVPFADIKALAAQCITAFPYTIERNEKNWGSNFTFERLTVEADGEFFSYCDQDDIWLPEKIDVLYDALTGEGAALVCSDMYIIDGEGKQVADSITKVRRHHRFESGVNLASRLLVRNWVTGCTTLLSASNAKNAVPFCPYMVHDHYLALWCAKDRKITCVSRPLIRHRIHEDNQTLAMSGVHDRESYLEGRIRAMILRFEWLENRFADEAPLLPEIENALRWARAREANFLGSFKAKRTVWKYRKFGPFTSLFEIVMSGAPNKLFMYFVGLKRRNIL